MQGNFLSFSCFPGFSLMSFNPFKAIEIPDKAENGIHIFLKRDPQAPPQDMSSVPAKLDSIEKMFLQFSSIMQKGMQDVLHKMTNIQDLMVTIANQQQEQTNTRRDSQEEMHYHQKHQVQISNEHLYPVHSQEEVQMLEEEEDEQEEGEEETEEIETEEYILDGDEPVDVVDEDEVRIEVTNSKRRDSFSPRPSSRLKKIKREIIPIQNYKDEARQASDDLIHIVEAVAASESIQSNVDGEEIIEGTTFIYQDAPTITNIKIRQDSKYELVPLTEELDFDFPLTTLDDLRRLNTCLNEDEQMVEAMKHKLAEISTAADFNFQKALQKLLSDNVMHQLNWQGLKGKFRMKDMPLFALILYQTWFQHIEFDLYEELLKVITKKAHKRYSKTMERKRHRIQGGPNRIVQDLAASMKTGIKTEMHQL